MKQKLFAVALLLCATVVLGSCRGEDPNRAKHTDESERLSKTSPADRGAPGNPRGPTDPTR
jgi:hypothetical protein